MRIGVCKMDECRITIGIEPTNDYMKAKQDVLQAMESIQKLSPIERQRLAEELLGTTQFMVLSQMFHQHWR